MEIVILAWGSLVWQPENQHGALAVRSGSPWAPDGPRLPVEFARISADGRLTLVLLPWYPSTSPVVWTVSGYDDLGEARRNLAARETGAPIDAIHAVTSEGEVLGEPDRSIVMRVSDWLGQRSGVGAAIWTGLPPGDRWAEHGYDGFSVSAAVEYMSALEGDLRMRAIEYVRNAPPQVDTPVRRALSGIGDL